MNSICSKFKNLILFLSIIPVLTGCSNMNLNSLIQQEEENSVYVIERYSLGDYTFAVNNISNVENDIYFSTRWWDSDEIGVNNTNIFKYHFQNQGIEELPFCIKDKGNSSVLTFCMNRDGSCAVLFWEEYDGQDFYSLQHYDINGALISEYDITNIVDGNIARWSDRAFDVYMDSKGNLFFYNGSMNVIGINPEGEQLFKIKFDDYISSLAINGDERLYVAHVSKELRKKVITEIDIESGKRNKMIKNIPGNRNSIEVISGSKKNRLYIEDDTAVYEYNLINRRYVKLFNWRDLGLERYLLRSIVNVKDNSFCGLYNDFEDNEYQIIRIVEE